MEDYLMIERTVKRDIHCPVCGKVLCRAKDESEVDIHCDRCNSDIIATVIGGMISTMEDRRNRISQRQGAVSVSVVKENRKGSEKVGGSRCLNTMAM
jgi:phage FluMu protein Com